MNYHYSGKSQPNSDINLGIGIDYGTSNSAAAVYDGQKVYLIQLDVDSIVIPSATYIDREFKIETGQKAIDAYIQSNEGRTVELSSEVLGEQRTATGQIGDRGLPEEANTEKVYGQSFIDAGQEGRLFRGVKRLLGNHTETRLMVFDRPFRLVAVITPLLIKIKTTISYFSSKCLMFFSSSLLVTIISMSSSGISSLADSSEESLTLISLRC